MLWPKKNSYKEFVKKKFLRLENSPPSPPSLTPNFSNGPSLRYLTSAFCGKGPQDLRLSL